MSQVITIHPDGLASGLHYKKGKGLDLRALGPVSIERVSLVTWDDVEQAWFIKFIAGPRAGTEWTLEALNGLTLVGDMGKGVQPGLPNGKSDGNGRLYFEDYDEAVRTEIVVLDSDRLAGVS